MPAPAPSQNPCPSGFPNKIAFLEGVKEYLLRGITLVFSHTKVTPGTSTTKCICYFSTNITVTIPLSAPIVKPNPAGPLACVPDP